MKVFHLNTKNTSYIFRVTPSQKLEQLHYGKRIKPLADYSVLTQKNTHMRGNTVTYHQEENLTLDDFSQEYSSVGRGDFSEVACEIWTPKSGLVSDFLYQSHQTYKGKPELQSLPSAFGDELTCQTIEVELKDPVIDVTLILYYHVFFEQDVIVRSVTLKNQGTEPLVIKRLMSMQLDLPFEKQSMISFGGAWAREMQKTTTPLTSGVFKIDSKNGTSSNRHNPFFMLTSPFCTEVSGDCYGFNLMYSGNHCELIEVTPYRSLRILSGINPTYFSYTVNPGEQFEAPEAVMSFSSSGLNQLSQQFHHFINEYIVPEVFAKKERPILINNWEATYFDFNEKKLLQLAKSAKELGIELFVLDDGWFGRRDDDTSSLGDWDVFLKKLPSGLNGLCDKIKSLDLQFGLWVEPEMISPNSELYRKHPEWAMSVPGREPLLGRNQLILDLTRKEVIDYLENVLTKVFKSCDLSYVKWDMNRNFSDMYSTNLSESQQGEVMHRYVLGLYDLMNRLTKKFPHILFEGCSAGGNRFDLGMMRYMPQIWTSDNTDASERVRIQRNASYGYPISVMGAHVSVAPNHQTLRDSSIESRFNVASFGVLGYELDLTELSVFDKKAVKAQIEFYKKYRSVFQFGTLYRLPQHDENIYSQLVITPCEKTAILSYYQERQIPNGYHDILKTLGLNPDFMYQMQTRPQKLNIKMFGNLINEALPVKLKQDGVLHNIVAAHYDLSSEVETYESYGEVFNHVGVKLNSQFGGVGYNEQTRVLGDIGSRLYVFNQMK